MCSEQSCTSFYIVAIQNTLNLSLNPDIVCTEDVEVTLMVSINQSISCPGA